MDLINNGNFLIAKNNGSAICDPIITDIIQDSTPKEESLVITREHFTQSPWIAPNYFDVRQKLGDNIKIEFYVTDYSEAEYRELDYSKRFQVEVIFEGNVIRKTVKAGDNFMYIGSASSVGETYFTIQVTDLQNNIKSFKYLINLFIIDPNFQYITYMMTNDDLTTYKLNNTGSTNTNDMTNNINGLNKLMSDKKAEGYNKLIMLKGTYMVNMGATKEKPINIPSYFTLDLNGAKIKQKFTEKGGGSLIINQELGAVDSHIINGTVEGDFDEHDLSKPPGADYPYEGESFNTIALGEAFCSIEDMNIGYATGYSIMTGRIHNVKVTATSNYTNCYINFDGEEIECDFAMTSDYANINKLDAKFMMYNRYLGYGGLSGLSDIAYVHFYDEDKNYINSVKVRQFAQFVKPTNAVYARGTLLASYISDIGTLPDFESRDYLNATGAVLRNIHSYNTRTCAMATGVFNFMLVEGCTFDNCGNSVTPVAIDIEDGYEYGQNYFFRNNRIIKHTGTADLIITRGYNHQIESSNFDLRERGGKGLAMRGGYYNGREYRFDPLKFPKTGFRRIEKATFRNKVVANELDATNPNYHVFRNCTFLNNVECKGALLYDCKIIKTWDGNSTSSFTGYNCDVTTYDNWHLNGGSTLYNCTLRSIPDKDIFILTRDVDNLFQGCFFKDKTRITGLESDKASVFRDCTFTDLTIQSYYWENGITLTFENCTITSESDALLSMGQWFLHYPIKFKNCDITCNSNKGLGDFSDNRGAKDMEYSYIEFENCRINAPNCNYLLQNIDGNYKNDGIDNILKIRVTGCTLSEGLKWYDESTIINKKIGETFIFEES